MPVYRENGVINLDESPNYVEAKAAYDALRNPKMQLVPVETLDEAINWLVNYEKHKIINKRTFIIILGIGNAGFWE